MDIPATFDVVKCTCNISNVSLFCVIFKEITIFLQLVMHFVFITLCKQRSYNSKPSTKVKGFLIPST